MDGFYVSAINDKDDFSGFDCGTPDLNDFIRNDALTHQGKLLSKTYVCHREVDDKPVAFYSVTMDSIKKQKVDDRDSFEISNIPCYKIARLAVDREYQRKGIGETLLYDCVYHAKELSKQIGCRLVTVDSKPDAVDFYLKKQFKMTAKQQKQKYPTLYLDLATIP